MELDTYIPQELNLTQKLIDKLTERKIPAVLAEGINIGKEEDIDSIAADIETKYNAIRQRFINENFRYEENHNG
jgi:hypothetical protein